MKGGDHESAQGAERERRDADRAGDDDRNGGSGTPTVRLEVELEELDRQLRDVGALVIPRLWDPGACDSLVRAMTASESRATEPLNLLTGKREPSPGARQKMHVDLPFVWWYAFRYRLRTGDELDAFLREPYLVDERVLFLSYEPGSFIAPHRDEDPKELAAATLVLNDDFEGGQFVIHEGDRELQLDVPTGSVIAFRAGVLHSVREVTAGTRYSVVGSLNRIDCA